MEFGTSKAGCRNVGRDFNDYYNEDPETASASLREAVARASKPGMRITQNGRGSSVTYSSVDAESEGNIVDLFSDAELVPGLEVRDAEPTPKGAELEIEQRKRRLLNLRIDFNDKTEIPRLELIGGLFPRGYLSFVASQQGLGKSWLMQRLAIDLSLGGTVLDGLQEDELVRRVVFLCGESRWSQFSRRANQARWSIQQKTLRVYDQWTMGQNEASLDLDTQEGRVCFEMILADEKPDIVVIDSLFDFHDSDENKSTDMKPILKFLNALAEKFNVAFAISHHCRKRRTVEQKIELDQDSMQGSNLLHKSASMIYMLQERTIRNSFGTTIEGGVLVSCKKSWTRKPPHFAFRIEDEDDGYHVRMRVILNPDLGGTQRDRATEIIEENFQPGDWFSRQEIINRVGGRISPATIKRTLKSLQEQGILIDNGEGSRNLRYAVCDMRCERKEK